MIFRILAPIVHPSKAKVGGGSSAPTPPKCRPKGLRNVSLWASPGLRLMIAVGKY